MKAVDYLESKDYTVLAHDKCTVVAIGPNGKLYLATLHDGIRLTIREAGTETIKMWKEEIRKALTV